MAGMRISELAEYSGFPATTLRYYETVGLLRPGRDQNGYRRYTHEDMERTLFVAHAKQLGLSLEEIARLVMLREDGSCPPVRDRLDTLLGEKISETRRSIAELTAFETELSRMRRDLGSSQAPASCGKGCGCLDQPLSIEAVRSVGCSLDPGEAADRVIDFEVGVPPEAHPIVTALFGEPIAGAD